MVLLSHLLLRAPLLPARAIGDPEALGRDPLGILALRLASPTLATYADERAARARRNYGARAAFRSTPQGLLAGVAVVHSDAGASRVTLGSPRAHLAVSFARLAALGRALLATPAGLRAAKLRVAPSLLSDGRRAQWVAFGAGAQARVETAVLDELVAGVLELADRWTSASRVVRRIAAEIDDVDGALALVLELVDDGLLQHDLEPPLVGRPPATWARERLVPLCPALGPVLDLLRDEALEPATRARTAEAALAALPGHIADDALVATLCHDASGTRIARAPLERAAALAPSLFALADALTPPLRERELVPGVAAALAGAGALLGEGLYPVAPLELGHYGGGISQEDDGARPPADASVVARLTAAIVAAARAGEDELVLDVATLGLEPITPASFELQLAPCTPPPGAREGTDWLLGLHGPAGASWGRFSAALGEPMTEALAELERVELELDEAALRVDVAYAPSRELADLCQGPALRTAALAISSWPEEGALRPAECALAHDPASRADGGIVAGGRAIVVSPLHRVRSTTAPPSTQRALLADTLLRQHAPWALTWGALAELPWLPRVRLEGFVIAPQSWALPTAISDENALLRWRKAERVPQHVQCGQEDALLPIDLERTEDRRTLLSLAPEERRRVHEIWPPLGRELDGGGRRVELICGVVKGVDAARVARLEVLRPVLTPAEGAAAIGWRTIRVYAARPRHDELIEEIAAHLERERVLLGWFFLPYVDEAGRAHLRVRLRARDEKTVARLATALERALRGAIARGDVAAIEVGAYHPEHARFGRSMSAVERIFEADSAAVIEAQRADTGELPRVVGLVAAFDAIADGLGLSLAQKMARVADALSGYVVEEEEERAHLAPAYRALQRPLRAGMEQVQPTWLVAHIRRVRGARLRGREAEALLPTLLHLAAVRRCGTDRDEEVRALYLWRRTLESLRATGSPPRRRSPRRAARRG